MNTHDYKNTKTIEILMMTNTTLRENPIKKRASHPSSIREPDIDFQKLVVKLEQAEITMKLEVIKKVKLQYVKKVQTTTSDVNKNQESYIELAKSTQTLNI